MARGTALKEQLLTLFNLRFGFSGYLWGRLGANGSVGSTSGAKCYG
jgi:hypothetical protein